MPPVVAFTRSKIFMTVTTRVVTTTITVGRDLRQRDPPEHLGLGGAVDLGRLDAARRARDLIAAESTTMAKPVWIQIMITMMKKLFHGR